MESSSQTPSLEISASRQFTSWLVEHNLSLAFTTYQAGKIFFVGTRSSGKLAILERTLERPMGMTVSGSSLYVSTLYQIWRFENILSTGERQNEYDAFFSPQVSFVTGDLDVHDIAIDDQGKLFFINTLFSCLATVSQKESFVPLWKPSFVSKLASEDRCHLNGLAMRDGKPSYVTTISQTDILEGWREHRRQGGCIIDVQNNEIIASNLSMPHSPRWYQGKLWVLNSGTGEFGWINFKNFSFETLTFCPGYLRGLAFHNQFAIVGLSKPRHNKSFSGLELNDVLRKKQVSARCGLLVIDLRTGDIVHSLTVEGVVEELYDVSALPNIRHPYAVGFQNDEIRRVIKIAES